MDFVPSWVPLISNKPKTHAHLPKNSGQRNLLAKGQTSAANPNPGKANPTSAPKGPGAAKPFRPPQPITRNPQPATRLPIIRRQAKGRIRTLQRPAPRASPPSQAAQRPPIHPRASSPAKFKAEAWQASPGPCRRAKPATSEASKDAVLAMNEPAKGVAKPAVPATAKSGDEVDPFAENADAKPAAKSPAEPDVSTPAKATPPVKPDEDLFGGSPPVVAPVKENAKPDTKPDAKPPVEPDVSDGLLNRNSPAKPDELFGAPPAVALVRKTADGRQAEGSRAGDAGNAWQDERQAGDCRQSAQDRRFEAGHEPGDRTRAEAGRKARGQAGHGRRSAGRPIIFR